MLHKVFIILKCLLILFPAIHSQKCFSQKYDAELINQQTILDVSEKRLVQKYFFEIRIYNRNGDKYADISIPFNKMNKVYDLEASITDNSGKEVQKLKKSDIIERSENSAVSFYDDTYLKEFTLRNHTYPYTLKYSYSIEVSQFLFLTHWLPVLDYKIPTRQAILKLVTTGGYKISYHSNLVDRPKIDSIPGRVYYEWQTSYINTFSAETWSPPLQQVMPYVEIVPQKFRYVSDGSNESWESFGNWNLSLLNGLNDLPLTEKFKIHSLTDSIGDEKEKIRRLFHYLQDETRYINVSIKTGGMKPYPASYVAENKYGDCKALTNYFKSCLSVINIKGFYTTINAGDEIETLETGFPSQQFNHVILYIPRKQDTLWVDCTSDLAFGYLGTFTQNRPALVLNDNTSSLIMTPKLSFEEVMENRKINAKINAFGSLKAEFTSICRGGKYELLSFVNSSMSELERTQYLGKKIVETGFQLDTYAISVPQRDVPEIMLKYTASSDRLMKAYGNESLLKIIPLEFSFLEEPKNRKLPVQINYPVYRIDSCEYAIPENYSIAAIPKNINLNSTYGEYHVNFQVRDHTLLCVKQVKINSGSYPLNEYQNFYAFIKSILEFENSFYITLKTI